MNGLTFLDDCRRMVWLCGLDWKTVGLMRAGGFMSDWRLGVWNFFGIRTGDWFLCPRIKVLSTLPEIWDDGLQVAASGTESSQLPWTGELGGRFR